MSLLLLWTDRLNITMASAPRFPPATHPSRPPNSIRIEHPRSLHMDGRARPLPGSDEKAVKTHHDRGRACCCLKTPPRSQPSQTHPCWPCVAPRSDTLLPEPLPHDGGTFQTCQDKTAPFGSWNLRPPRPSARTATYSGPRGSSSQAWSDLLTQRPRVVRAALAPGDHDSKRNNRGDSLCPLAGLAVVTVTPDLRAAAAVSGQSSVDAYVSQPADGSGQQQRRGLPSSSASPF